MYTLVLIVSSVIRANAIWGGENASITDFPYQVSIEYVGHQRCGGAIIAKNWIVTNAQCVVFSKIDCSVCSFHKVRAGTDLKEEGGTLHQVDKIIQHEKFYKKVRFLTRFDIALWHVKEPFEFDETRQPIPLFEAFDKPALNQTANLTGFDYFENLQWIEVPVVEYEFCDDYYSRLNVTTEGTMCAGYYEEVNDMVPGWADEGGPLVVDGRLAGIVSEVKDSYSPVVYTEIAYFRDWIDQHLDSEPPDTCNI